MALLSRRRLVNLLRVFWVLVVVWYEYGTFIASVRVCNWPDASETADITTTTTVEDRPRPYHVLLVADPLIVDWRSYPSRTFVGSYLTRLIGDLNLRKNWQAALQKKPDAVVFLGNMMDSGRDIMPHDEYESLFQRFSSIFSKQGQDFEQYFIPGNHDIGLGESSTFATNAHARYVSHFGPSNYEVSVANHTLVFFDAPRYSDEDSMRHGQRKAFKHWKPMKNGSLEFMMQFTNAKHTDPVILFSHIPLYRSDGKPCGPLRERGTLRPGVGFGYQNTLEKQTTLRLLEAFKPEAVFSGDNLDYCEYTHQIRPVNGPPRNTLETTIKTISMLTNVRRPGFQLLSLYPEELRQKDEPSYLDTSCLLPDQTRIYLNIYLPLVIVSLLVILLPNLQRGQRYAHSKASSDVGQIAFSVDADISDHEETEMKAYHSNNSSSSSLPLPASLSHQRSPQTRTAGWFVIQGSDDQDAEKPSISQHIHDILYFFWPGKPRTPPHRRGWGYRFIRDVRDVAVFPLGLLVVITLWVVTR